MRPNRQPLAIDYYAPLSTLTLHTPTAQSPSISNTLTLANDDASHDPAAGSINPVSRFRRRRTAPSARHRRLILAGRTHWPPDHKSPSDASPAPPVRAVADRPRIPASRRVRAPTSGCSH